MLTKAMRFSFMSTMFIGVVLPSNVCCTTWYVLGSVFSGLPSLKSRRATERSTRMEPLLGRYSPLGVVVAIDRLSAVCSDEYASQSLSVAGRRFGARAAFDISTFPAVQIVVFLSSAEPSLVSHMASIHCLSLRATPGCLLNLSSISCV